MAASSSTATMTTAENSVMHLAFNQDSSCLAVSLASGVIRVYHTASHEICYERSSPGEMQPVALVEMLYATSLLATAGSGTRGSSPRRVSVLNTASSSEIASLSFVSSVLAVRLSRSRLCVLLEQKLLIHELDSLALRISIDIPKRAVHRQKMCAMSAPPNASFFALPLESGGVLVVDAGRCATLGQVDCHTSPAHCVAISHDGSTLASASERGTLIKLHALPSAAALGSFRRGSTPAEVFALAMGPPDEERPPRVLCAASSGGTVHVFSLVDSTGGNVGVGGGGRSGSTSSSAGGMAAKGAGIAAWVLSSVPPLRDVDAPRASVAIKLPSRCRTVLAILPSSSLSSGGGNVVGNGASGNGGGGGGGNAVVGSGSGVFSSSDDEEFRVGVVDCIQGILYEYVVRVGGSDGSAGGSDVWTASLRRELIIRMGDVVDSRHAR